MERRYAVLLESLIWFSTAALLVGVGFLVFEIRSADPDGLALVGSLGLIVTQTIALIGVLARKSAEREAEQRLKAETSIKALELIEVGDPSLGSRAQAGAAAHLLLDLGYLDSAIALVDALWPQDAIERGAAMTVLDAALRSEDSALAVNATMTLSSNAARTLTPYPMKPSSLFEREFLFSADPELLDGIWGYFEASIESATLESSSRKGGDNLDRLTRLLNIHMPELLAMSGVDRDVLNFDTLRNTDIASYYVDMATLYIDALLPAYVASDNVLPAHQDLVLEPDDVREVVDGLLRTVDPRLGERRKPKKVKARIESQVEQQSLEGQASF